MTETKPQAEVLDFREARTRLQNRKKPIDDKYKPDFSKFQSFLNKSDNDKKK